MLELWSVRAITFRPLLAASSAKKRGDKSSDPQGERQEWLCRSVNSGKIAPESIGKFSRRRGGAEAAEL